MNSMILVGLLGALAVSSATAGFLSGGYSGGHFGGGYTGGLLSTGSSLPSGPLATSSITQQRIIHSVAIPRRIISTPIVSSPSYYSGVQSGYVGGASGDNLGASFRGNFGASSAINSIHSGSNGNGNAGGNYGGYGRNGY